MITIKRTAKAVKPAKLKNFAPLTTKSRGDFGMTADNMITNKKVRMGQLPKSQLEVYPQRKPLMESLKASPKLTPKKKWKITKAR